MMKQRFLYILLPLLGLLFHTACQKEDISDQNPSQGQGSLTLNISSRSVTPGDGDVTTGGGMANLLVMLVDPSGTIIKGALLNNIGSATTGALQQTVQFNGVDLGNYTLFAYANKEGMSFKEGGKFTQQDQTFAELSGTNTPSSKQNQSFLSAKQDVTVKVGNNQTTLEMKRVVAKFRMNIFNHSTSDIYITNVSFGQFNSSTGYLFSHEGAIPTTNSNRALPPFYLQGEDRKIMGNHSKEIYSAYLYESNVPDQYYFNLSLSVGPPAADVWELVASSIDDNKEVYTISSGNNYIYDNNGTLGVRKKANITNITNTKQDFYWKIKRTSGGVTIQNASTGKYITITQQKDGRRYSYSIATGTNPFTLSLKDLNKSNSYYFYKEFKEGTWNTTTVTKYINVTNNNVGLADNEVELNLLSPQNTNSSSHNFNHKQIVTVDRQTAHVAPLTEILRNQDVGVILNVYYNDKNDQFTFDVDPWLSPEYDNEVEFN